MRSDDAFNILALDGGGIRGVYGAHVLARLEDTLGAPVRERSYMIGVGIERAKELADRSNEDLMSTLEETSALSRSAMWELRHPMEIGERPGRRRELSRPGPRRAQARSTAAFAQGAPWAGPPQS